MRRAWAGRGAVLAVCAWSGIWVAGALASARNVEAQYVRIRLEHPRISIGSAMGSDGSALAGVTGVARLTDDRFVVTEAMNPRVALFGGSGEPIRVIAREGSGPGEVRYPMWAGPCGPERVGVFDGNLNALLTFDSQGVWQSTRVLPEQTLFNEVLQCSADGTLLMLFRQPTGRIPTLGTAFGVGAHVARIDRLGAVDTLARAGATTYYIARNVNGFSLVPLAETTLVAAGRARIFIANNLTGQVQVLDTLGAPIRSWRPLFKERPVTSRDWTLAIDRYVSTVPKRQTQDLFRQVLSEVDRPASFPAIDVIAVDRSDHLWIRSYENFHAKVADWFVFDERGRALAGVRMPRGLRILDISANQVLGVEADANGVERVVLYDLSPVIQ